MIDIIVSFEDLIKKYKVLFFDKVYEKTRGGSWKLIYNIQGLSTEDTSMFYPNLKFIFWLNDTKTELTEDVISYLYSQSCDYKSISLDNDIEDVFETILKFIKNEKTNVELSEFILNGSDGFNKELKKKNINDFVSSLTYIPHGNKSCIETLFGFKIEMNTETYYFNLRCLQKVWEVRMGDDITIQTTLKEVYEKIIDIIYATK